MSSNRSGKAIIYEEFPGAFLKPCPGTGAPYICCGYQVLNCSLNCTLDCDYCILKAYLERDDLVIYTNTDRMFDELLSKTAAQPDRRFRIGTGELTDSLLLDPLTGLNNRLVKTVAGLPNVVLELKTKTTNIHALEGLDHRGHTIVAWSLAPQRIISRHEGTAASLGRRLRSAARVVSWGYPVAFHFDPVIHYPESRSDYREVIDRIFDEIPSESIRWISLGAFRYTPELGRLLSEQPRTRRLITDEFVRCSDGKYRYFWKIRVELLRPIAEMIHQKAPDVFCYLCMESQSVWREVLGWVPKAPEQLSDCLDQRAFNVD